MVRLGDETQEAIHRAHRHIEDQTCLRFKHKEGTDPDYISYINQPGYAMISSRVRYDYISYINQMGYAMISTS